MQNDAAAAPMIPPAMSKFPETKNKHKTWAEFLNSIPTMSHPDSDYFQSLGRQLYQYKIVHGHSRPYLIGNSDSGLC